MAKRRRKKPNIPEAAMEHARQKAGIDEEPDAPEAEAEEADQPEETTDTHSSSATSSRSRSRRRRRSLQRVQLDKRKNEGALDSEYVAERLAHPTKVVTEDELREDYSYVIKDLRNMGILAAVLLVALIVMALIVL